MAKSPLQTVKERFKDKAGLVSAVKGLMSDELWIDRLNDNKGLDRVSNQKLLHLHEVLSQVKSQFGSRAKLIDAIATASGRAKDAEYKQGLQRFPTPRLFNLPKLAEARQGLIDVKQLGAWIRALSRALPRTAESFAVLRRERGPALVPRTPLRDAWLSSSTCTFTPSTRCWTARCASKAWSSAPSA